MFFLPVCLVLALAISNADAAADPCPHQLPGLRSWSEPSSWSSGKKPIDGDDVVIDDDVLFDDITPRLLSITITPTGRLIWSPSGDYHLTVSTVLIEGRMDIGSEQCKLDAKAHITLIGDRDTAPKFTEDNDQKGIIVMPGGTLEIHGKQKLSWTKLTSTLPKLANTDDLIFDHAVYVDTVDPKLVSKNGLYVYVFEPTSAQMVDFKTFKTGKKPSEAFKNYLDSIDDGNIVMVASKKRMFNKKAQEDLVCEAVETLLFGAGNGPTELRDATSQSGDAYAMLAVKGDRSKSQEIFTPTDSTLEGQSARLYYLDSANGYKYSVEAYFDNIKKRKSFASFRIITLKGMYPVLNVIDDTSSWRPGDQVFLTSTDYDWEQAEEATVVECIECTPRQVKIKLEAKYTHWGEITDGVDMRGEVALLTRNILIEGEVQDFCPPANGNCANYTFDTFGGHLKVHKIGFKNVHIEGAEFHHMGQQTDLGHYPIHFHMCEDVDGYENPPYVRDNSIHDSFARCITVHGTHGLTLQDNVGYKAMGHCFFLEDGGEKRTTWDGNLGASIRPGSLIPTDGLNNFSVFWVTSPVTYMRNNVAAGSAANGMWYIFPDEPLDHSKETGWFKLYEARGTPIPEFTNNVCHSCRTSGLRVDNRLAPNGEIISKSKYMAREDPLNDTSPYVEVNFHRVTAYKNGKENIWIAGVWMTMHESGSSDSATGISFVGKDGNRNSVNTSIILGDSPNIGEPGTKGKEIFERSFPYPGKPNYPVIGYFQYGSPVQVYDTWFNYFGTTERRQAGALGFTRRVACLKQPRSSVRTLDWGFDDGVGLGNRFFDGDEDDYMFGPKKDADKTQTWRDIDGTSTGIPDTFVLPPRPFHLTDKCFIRENWKMAVCPYRYAKLKMRHEGAEGAVPFAMRDDLPTLKEERVKKSSDFIVILGGLYTYTIHWTPSTPKSFRIVGRGVEKDYPVRVGICLPRDAEFEIHRRGPRNVKWGKWTAAKDVSEVDDDDTGTKYFWDFETELLFVKFQHPSPFTSEFGFRICPDGKCDSITITLIRGTRSDSDCSGRAYGPYTRTITDTTVKLTQPEVLPKTSSSPPPGYGAGSTRPFRTRPLVDGGFGQWSSWGQCSATCGEGERVKTRACDNPIPQHGGELCAGERVMREPCNTDPC